MTTGGNVTAETFLPRVKFTELQTKLVSRMADLGMSVNEVKDTLLDENEQPRTHMVGEDEVSFTATQIQGILSNPGEYGLVA